LILHQLIHHHPIIDEAIKYGARWQENKIFQNYVRWHTVEKVVGRVGMRWARDVVVCRLVRESHGGT
jgi:hypothetical protein